MINLINNLQKFPIISFIFISTLILSIIFIFSTLLALGNYRGEALILTIISLSSIFLYCI